jgi:hypothetical protein
MQAGLRGSPRLTGARGPDRWNFTRKDRSPKRLAAHFSAARRPRDIFAAKN